MTSSLNLDAILASVGEVPYSWTIDTDSLEWGGNAREVLKAPPDADIATGRGFALILEASARQLRFETVMRGAVSDFGQGVPYHLEYAANPIPDVTLWLEDCGRWFAGPDGKPMRAQGVIRVVNERHAQHERLTFLSRFDPLTGEMNRAYMTEVLGAAIEESIKQRSACGFLLVAIDNLAGINEAYGYEVADELIGAVAKRIRIRLRGQDYLGRYSGNKFGVILKNCTPEDMNIAADRLLAGIRDEVVPTQAGAIAVTVTIGGVTAPRYARTLPEALSRVQDALDSARSRRRGSFQAYHPNVEREERRQANVRSTDEILAALNERRVSLVYEPVASISSRQPAFYECLMRVRRHDGSIVAAQDVVPAAERLGLVRLLDHRVLAMVLDELVAAPNLKASLNVSPPSTTDPGWWTGLGEMLRAHPGVAERLTVEITETAAIHDIDETRGFVARVKDLGCRIAIDDFGAGYTSFRNLRKLAVDIVKIDGAFVQNLCRSEDDRAFVHTLLDLAKRLRLETVAEWVQDEETVTMLRGWGCDYVQGALIGLASPQRPWRPDDGKAAVSA